MGDDQHHKLAANFNAANHSDYSPARVALAA